MDDRQRSRMAVAHAALTLLRRRDFRTIAGDTNGAGEHVIVPALPDDPMGFFFDQLRAVDGPIYATLLEGDGVVVLGMSPRRLDGGPKHGVPPALGDTSGIHPNTQIALVLEYLRVHKRPVTCYEVAPSVSVELVDDKRVDSPMGCSK